MQTWSGSPVTIAAWQAIPQQMQALGLTDADGLEQVWFVDGDGRLTGGAAAVNAALRYIWWARPFTWLYGLPFMPQIEEKVYRWVADNRHRLPGSALQCTTETKP